MVCSATIVASLVALTLTSGGPAPVTLGTAAFAPYVYVGDDGEISGFDRDLGDEVCAQAHLDCTWQVAPFDQLLPGVMQGRFDLAIGGIARTPERATKVDFSDPYTDTDDQEAFYGRPGAPGLETALIGVESGTMQEDYLRATGRNFVSFASNDAMVAALIAGQTDLAVGMPGSDDMDQMLLDNGIEWLFSANVPDQGTGIALCKGNKPLQDQVNAALAAMVADGTIDRLSADWF